jgi:Flp pilus assembly pilin Flp
MTAICNRMWQEEDGVLTFEWILLVTLLVIGIVGGLAGVRDAVIDELGDVAQAMIALDQSYTVCNPLLFIVHDICDQGASGSEFIDNTPLFAECERNSIDGQGPVIDP